uniref:Uncharacterized protein n=1 Tax=Arundo donax TaxID=35708 RepID=A0A0A8YZC3_ARUDO
MQELQFLCYPHNSCFVGCMSFRREVEGREGGDEEELLLDFLSEGEG